MRKKLPIVLSAAALIVAVLAWQTPAIAHGVQHAIFAHNADKVDGRHANQLVRGTTIKDDTVVDDFGADTFTPLLTKSVRAPKRGILLVWGTIAAVHDVSGGTPSVLNARIRVGPSTTTTQAVHLVYSGTEEGSLAISGAVRVSKGTKNVVLEAFESEGNLVFITNKSITTLYVPYGNAGKVGLLGRSIPRESGATAARNG